MLYSTCGIWLTHEIQTNHIYKNYGQIGKDGHATTSCNRKLRKSTKILTRFAGATGNATITLETVR
jgi:hypothetical protein